MYLDLIQLTNRHLEKAQVNAIKLCGAVDKQKSKTVKIKYL